ncbi:MAG: DUF4062 domain-containing protein [Planctomycetota bacterium]
MAGSRVFISSTGDLRAQRDLAAGVIRSLGYDPRWQDQAATEPGELLAALRKWVKQSETVVQLVGRSYGSEPPVPIGEAELPGGLPAGMVRCSYTQYEALYAEAIGKPVRYVWIDRWEAGDTDQGLGDEQEPADRALQEAYRQYLIERNVVRHEASGPESLENRLFRMREWLEEARDDARRRHRWMTTLVVAVLAIGVVTVGLLWQQNRASEDRDLAVMDKVRQVGEQAEATTEAEAKATRQEVVEAAELTMEKVDRQAEETQNTSRVENLETRKTVEVEGEKTRGVLEEFRPGASPVEAILTESGVASETILVEHFGVTVSPESAWSDRGAMIRVEPTMDVLLRFASEGMIEVKVGQGAWRMVLVSTFLSGYGYYAEVQGYEVVRGGRILIRVDSLSGMGTGRDVIGPLDTGIDIQKAVNEAMKKEISKEGVAWLFKKDQRWYLDTMFLSRRSGKLSAAHVGPSPQDLSVRFDFPPPLEPDISANEKIDQSIRNNMKVDAFNHALIRFKDLDTLYGRLDLLDGTHGEVRKFVPVKSQATPPTP